MPSVARTACGGKCRQRRDGRYQEKEMTAPALLKTPEYHLSGLFKSFE
jgi:hypothetical protein